MGVPDGSRKLSFKWKYVDPSSFRLVALDSSASSQPTGEEREDHKLQVSVEPL